MKLTRKERWFLSNQYRILEALYPKDASSLAKQREAVERGYELHYGWLCEHIYSDDQTMSEADCREVIDILDMFSTIKETYNALADKSGIDAGDIRFLGFSGNDEGSQMAYARYFCTFDGERFPDLDRGDNFNSHFPMLEAYRRMLAAWEQARDKHHLTRDDLVRIVSARKWPGDPA